MRYLFPRKPRVQNMLSCVPGLKEPRYLAFSLAFGICSSSLTWCIGAFEGTAVAELGDNGSRILRQLFTFLANASFLSGPLLGYCVDRFGPVPASFVQVVCTQLFLVCFLWPSFFTLALALPISNLTSSSVWSLQGAYLLTFPQEHFTILFCGTLFVQVVAMLVVDFGPKQGADAANFWIFAVLLSYAWPLLHILHSRRSPQVVTDPDSLSASIPFQNGSEQAQLPTGDSYVSRMVNQGLS